MPIPPTATAFGDSLDPTEELDFDLPLTPLLEEGEKVASFSLVLLPEAVLYGLTIMSGAGRSLHAINGGTVLKMWFTIAEGYREDPIFSGGGISLPMLLTLTTDATPPRVRQRTVLLPVVQK